MGHSETTMPCRHRGYHFLGWPTLLKIVVVLMLTISTDAAAPDNSTKETTRLHGIYKQDVTKPFTLMLQKDASRVFSQNYTMHNVEAVASNTKMFYRFSHAQEFVWKILDLRKLGRCKRSGLPRLLIKMSRTNLPGVEPEYWLKKVLKGWRACNRWLLLDHEGMRFLRYYFKTQKGEGARARFADLLNVKMLDAMRWWKNEQKATPKSYEDFQNEISDHFYTKLDAPQVTEENFMQTYDYYWNLEEKMLGFDFFAPKLKKKKNNS